jgi:hypothetical protein
VGKQYKNKTILPSKRNPEALETYLKPDEKHQSVTNCYDDGKRTYTAWYTPANKVLNPEISLAGL